MIVFNKNYDVIVVGAGHAGNEAAVACSKLGMKSLLLTMNLQTIGQMSCNPAMGGVAKGQIIREIDALGGFSGIITDLSTLQFRMLNKSKGPAMWSPRAQCDKNQFAQLWRDKLESLHNLDLYQDSVNGLILEKEKVIGVQTTMGMKIYSKAVILTTGTFMNGLIHIGDKMKSGGRLGENKSSGISEQLLNFGFKTGRMKTGTPPRIDKRSIDFTNTVKQDGDKEASKFSYQNTNPIEFKNQIPCHIAYTSAVVHEMIEEAIHLSPMYNGQIDSIGPRYCPSIEDKIHKFADKDSHQLFIEPETRNSYEMYINGFSTSLPMDIQQKALAEIPAFKNAHFLKPGYAIEYDYFDPTQLKKTLETSKIENLYFAGQINGTTGYEEAGSQGLMAGINASLKIKNEAEFILDRSDAYIGVLIDDLTNKGTIEPYRMFTSRAEYRILLRQDNADQRLLKKAYDMGMQSEEALKRLNTKWMRIEDSIRFMELNNFKPQHINSHLKKINSSPLTIPQRIKKTILRPEISLDSIKNITPLDQHLKNYSKEELEQIEIQIKYAGYLDREKENVKKLKKFEQFKIPKNFSYEKLESISFEGRLKLNQIQPKTIYEAKHISGVSPSDIQVLLVYLGK